MNNEEFVEDTDFNRIDDWSSWKALIQMAQSSDLFGKTIADTTKNESNLASHYPYNPERWRLYSGENATPENRLFPEYNTVSQYNHAGDVHELTPAAGETVIFESAERYRYIVQYELIASFSMAVNQSLSGNDRIRAGFYCCDDGWFLEHNGSHADDECDLVQIRDGVEQYRETRSINQTFQDFQRYSFETAWYNISRQLWKESYAENGVQKNPTIGKVSLDDEKGPRTGNLNIRYEVRADANTTDLVLETGSAALVTKGSGEDVIRRKGLSREDSFDNDNTWEPIRAFRNIPDKEVVNNQLALMETISFNQNNDVKLLMMAFSKTNVTFTGTDSWSTPPEWNRTNNSLETRIDVDTIVDSTGTATATADDPGGFQISKSTLTDGGKIGGATSVGVRLKRNIPNGDIAVIMAKSASAGTVGYSLEFEEDW